MEDKPHYIVVIPDSVFDSTTAAILAAYNASVKSGKTASIIDADGDVACEIDAKALTWTNVFSIMSAFNEKHGIKHSGWEMKNERGEDIVMEAKVVVKESFFSYPTDEKHRTFYFNNYNKALCSDDGGYSIFASNHQELTLFRIEDLHNHQVESAEIIKVTE